MRKFLLFLSLIVAMVCKAQTKQELLPVGTMAPDFTVTDSVTGKKLFSLSELRTQVTADGKVKAGGWVVLDFWASWCPDCRKDMPTVKKIDEKYGKKIKLIGVSFDTDKAKMNGYLSANQYSWLQYSEFKKWKETQISKDYHISWIPTSYLIDPEGKIAFSTLNAEEMLKNLILWRLNYRKNEDVSKRNVCYILIFSIIIVSRIFTRLQFCSFLSRC